MTTALAIISIVMSVAALIIAWTAWRRARRAEMAPVQNEAGAPVQQDTFSGVELTLEAMLAELEAKGEEIIAAVEKASSSPTDPKGSPSATAGRMRASSLPEAADEKKHLVRKMADEGRDIEDIARQLGLGKGEVRLILDLPES